MSGLSVGILVDSTLKQQYLGNLVVQAGHSIGYVYLLTLHSELPSLSQDVDAWVVDINEPDDASNPRNQALISLLDDLLEQTQLPVIVNDGHELKQGSPEHNDWVRRTLQRLERLNGDINLQARGSASEVWVLGASTGGPAAVKDFIASLPANLNVAFIYAQHIDKGQAEALAKMMSSVGHYPAFVAQQGSALSNNTVTIITADRSINIYDNGTLMMSKSPWMGSYAPSINQISANVARVYRQQSGLIIFSGMGDDGATGGRLIKQQGGLVWAQSPEQSTIASMPREVIATGAVSFTGAPHELALALARLKQQLPVQKSTS